MEGKKKREAFFRRFRTRNSMLRRPVDQRREDCVRIWQSWLVKFQRINFHASYCDNY